MRRAADEQSDDNIDFKPYFDMVIGILFLLLIIISAQLFFTRYDDQALESEVERARREQLMQDWTHQIEEFLTRTAANISAGGVDATPDPQGRRILIRASQLVSWAAAGTGEARTMAGAVAQTAAALRQAANCATPAAPSGCPPRGLLALDGFSLDTLVIGTSPRQDQAPDSHAAAAAAVLVGAFGAAEPSLFDIRDHTGRPALTSFSEALPLPLGQVAETLLQVRFRFRPPLW